MADVRLGSAWPDTRPGIVGGSEKEPAGRARPGYSFQEPRGQGGGVHVTGIRFDEPEPGELVISEAFPAGAFLVESEPGELWLDDTVTAGLKIRATDSDVFVSD